MFDRKQWAKEYAKTERGKAVLKAAAYKYNHSEHGKVKRQAIEHSEGRKRSKQLYNASEKGRQNYKRGQEKYRRTLHGKFMLAKKAATYERHHQWTIEESDYAKLMENNCYYCGGCLPPCGSGLDRVDSSKEYTLDNVVPCCAVCNRAKGDWWTSAETKIAVQAVLAYRRDRVAEGNGV